MSLVRGRIGHIRPIRHDGVGGFGEEKWRIADVLPHLADVFLIIAADAPDAAHRKPLVGAGNRDGCLGRRWNDVAMSVGGHGLSCSCCDFTQWRRWRPAATPVPAAAADRTTYNDRPWGAAPRDGRIRRRLHPR